MYIHNILFMYLTVEFDIRYFRICEREVCRLPPGKVEPLDVPPNEHAVRKQQGAKYGEIALQLLDLKKKSKLIQIYMGILPAAPLRHLKIIKFL